MSTATTKPRPNRTDRTRQLLKRFAATGDRRHAAQIVEENRGLAVSRANRFQRPGVETDDLVQVALAGMWKAITRFRTDVGTRFSTFATATMDGELKRYMRDHTWDVHVPRGLKTLSLRATAAQREYVGEVGREPTVAELSQWSGVDTDDLEAGLKAAKAYTSAPLVRRGTDGAPPVALQVPAPPPKVDPATLVDLKEGVADLPPEQRRIVRLRFNRDLSQAEIADIVGVSQMQVSRLLRRSLRTLRSAVATRTPPR